MSEPTLSGVTPLLGIDVALAGTSHDVTAVSALQPFVAAAYAGAGRCVLAVTATGREAEDLTAALTSLLPADSVAELPSWETLPHERLSPSSDVVGRRLAVLRRLAHPDPHDPAWGPLMVVGALIRTLLQPIVRGLGDLVPVRLAIGEEAPREQVLRDLVDAGYVRVDLVEKRGQFAVRGAIVDVFPPAEEHPLRVEFWGDVVEEVRAFRVSDQRSLEVAPHGLWAPPVRELPLTDAVRERARALAVQHPELMDVLDRIVEGQAVEGMEALSSVLADGMETVLDALPPRSTVIVCDPERVRARAHELVQTSAEFLDASWVNAAAGNVTPIDVGGSAYRTIDDLRSVAVTLDIPWVTLDPFAADEELEPTELVEVVTATPADSYRGDTERAFADLRRWCADGWRVIVTTEGHGPAERIAESLRGESITASLVGLIDTEPVVGAVTVTTARLAHGFVAAERRLALLTEADIIGQRTSTKDMRRMPSKRRRAIDPLQLKSGDFVVHEQHGVGRYVEMIQRDVQGTRRDYIVLEYAASKRSHPPDRLFVPTDQLDQVTRYIGGEAPTLHRLGGSDWSAAKGKARRAVKQIAGELIRLYAVRNAAKGRVFGPDTPWQRELEDAFPYIETPDQMSAIDEVKADMEQARPMDRLICGDVGYGKTEIAVRAAFKAVQDGTQVAVLVPTTLLVQQHFSTFSERYAQFPVKVAALSRFSSDAESTKVLEGVADGSVDVVIGTHRLLSPSGRFKDLGLVIVDEEQRFGVEHKEYLKALRTNVDVLSMSATPIPRTLEMAVTGIRDMSTIQTPPEERLPVLTFVGPYDDRQITAAIRRELLREGQVFFVHNRVESIERVAARLRDLVPEARIQTAHGQLPESALEQVIVDFWEKSIDVLVCTTIVESGIDIANANTLVVDRADALGLSQLHQLRGRVGRGRERAYAYFLYPPEKPLTEQAHDRLSTIAQHTDLGSGMQIALKDLEIRGAGNLLGGEQSGHIAEVGFDLYIRMVGEALAEARGDAETPAEIRVELPIDAHIPHDYVPEERLRLEAYQRLAAAVTDADVDAVAEELLDRYGSLPTPVETLLAVARFRCLARSAGLDEVVLQGSGIRFHPVELPESRTMRLTRLHPGSVIKPAVRTIVVPRPSTARIGGTPVTGTALLEWASALVQTILLDRIAPATGTDGTGVPSAR